MASVEKNGKRWVGIARRMKDGKKFKRKKTFDSKRDALAWALEEEKQLGVAFNEIPLDNITFAQLIERYDAEVVPLKKSARAEHLRLACFLRDYPHFANKPMAKFDKRDVALWKESRLEKVSSSTVSREWCSLSAVITHAKRDWGMSIADNPFHLLRRPASNKPREQRINAADIEMVMAALGYTPGTRPELQRHFVAWAFLFAIETAMRAGEILKLQPDDINGKLATLRDTKNGYDRVVPLSAAARDLLALVDLPLSLSSRVLDTLFRRYRPAELAHIHFHDTRHEALSRLAKKIHNPMDLAKISGHRDVRILLNTYYNPDDAHLAGLLD